MDHTGWNCQIIGFCPCSSSSSSGFSHRCSSPDSPWSAVDSPSRHDER
jgi:hypothetical protein